MLDIFSGLRLVVKRRTINIDNAIFRCHWFFTSTLLVSFSLIITARQYVGQPIECHSVDKIPDSLLNSYCWVQSTFTVPQACQGDTTRKWEVPYPCIDNTRGREIKVYAYYQWVGIVLFVQGLMFHLPYYLWKLWENGLIKAITGGLRVAVLNEQERAKKKEIVVEYIHDHLGCHKRYALKYFLCEFICLINLMGQLWATNKFFDGQFLRYGLEVLEYSSSSFMSTTPTSQQPTIATTISISSTTNKQAGNLDNNNDNNNNNLTSSATYTRLLAHSATNPTSHQQQVVDPMTFIFPRMTKCSYFDFGPSGDVQKHDALCLLPLNIINEKIYIALWFWFLVLALLTLLVIVYRLLAIVSEAVRCKGLISRCKLSSERDIRLICRHCDVGDWFLFYMVAENLDPLIMREIIASIASKITDHLELKRELKAQLQREQLDDEDLQQRQKQQQQLEHELGYAGHHLSCASDAVELLPPTQPPVPSAPRASLCPSCSSQPSSRRGSLVDQMPPMVRKLKKRLYNKRLWSIDLGPPEARQQLFSQQRGEQSSPAMPAANVAIAAATTTTATASAFALTTGSFASGQPTSEMSTQGAPASRRLSLLISSNGLLHRRRRGSLTRQTSLASSSGVSSAGFSSTPTTGGSFVMEMASIRASSPCLLDGSLGCTAETETGTARWRQPNARHDHHAPTGD